MPKLTKIQLEEQVKELQFQLDKEVQKSEPKPKIKSKLNQLGVLLTVIGLLLELTPYFPEEYATYVLIVGGPIVIIVRTYFTYKPVR